MKSGLDPSHDQEKLGFSGRNQEKTSMHGATQRTYSIPHIAYVPVAPSPCFNAPSHVILPDTL